VTPQYAKYRESGIPWLPELPAHWQVKRMKQVFRERDERSADGSETLLSVSAYTGVTPRSEIVDDGDHLTRADSLVGYKICDRDDLVVNIMLAWNRGLGFSADRGIVSPAYCVFRVIDGSIPRFLNYLVRSDHVIAYFKAFSSGVVDSRLRIYPDTFGGLYCALPSPSEQVAIATFLDRETAKIDALVEEQKRLIELLKEKRQAVISQAVTKGLDPAVPMKDSGVEWLGQVPAHWRVGKAGFHVSVLPGFAFPSAGFTDDEADTPLLRGINVGVSRIRWDEIVYWRRLDGDGLDAYVLKEGDLVIGMDRPLIADGVRVAKVGLSDLPCLLLQRVAKISTSKSLDADYLFSLLSSALFVAHIFPATTGVSVPHISAEQIQEFVIPVPPLSEQLNIAEAARATSRAFAELTTQASMAIDLLQERRSALISAAVTGKIDVRGLVPQPEATPA
jgi:type I restriction enzyme S subunit